MMLDGAAVPEWPTTVHRDTRDEAIVAALDLTEPGDVIWVHQDACALRHGDPCDCAVQMVPALSGVVQ